MFSVVEHKSNPFTHNHQSAHFGLLRFHAAALVLFTLLSTVFLWEVLFYDKSLSAFDLFLGQPAWTSEYTSPDTHQLVLLDSPTAHFPQRQFDWQALKSGHNASLNPYIYLGTPWLSEGVGAFVTAWPQLLFDTPNGLDWTTWFRLILAGMLMYSMLLQCGLKRTAAIFGGIVWTYNLHQVVWIEFPQHLGTQLWIPALFGLNIAIFKNGLQRHLALALLLVNVLFATAGYTQIVLFTYLTIGLFNTIYLLIVDGESWSDRARKWFLIHAIYVAAALIYALGMYSQVDMLATGLRGGQEWRDKLFLSDMSWSSFGQFLFSLIPPAEEIRRLYNPDYYGGIWNGNFKKPFSNPVEYLAYPGALTVLLAFYALVSPGKGYQWRLLLCCLITFAIVLTIIYESPFMIWVLHNIPFAGKGNYSRFVTLEIFLLVLIAANGLQKLLQDYEQRPALRRLLLSLGLMFCIPLVVSLVGIELRLSMLIYPALICSLFVAVFWSFRFLSRWNAYLGLGVIVIVVLDLFAAGFRFNTKVHNDMIFPTNNIIRYLKADQDVFRVAVLLKENKDKPSLFYHPNMLSYYGIAEISGYSTVMSNDYAQFIQQVFPSHHITHNGIMAVFKPNIPIMRIMNVKYIISDYKLDNSELMQVLGSDDHYLYRIIEPLSRAYCASDIFIFDGDYKTVEHKVSQYQHSVSIADKVDKTMAGVCQIKNLSAYLDGMQVEVDAPAERLLVLSYTHHDNWRVTIDSEPATIIKANGTFMAVSIPAGLHSIKLYYIDDLQTIAAIVLIGFALLLIVLALVYKTMPWRMVMVVIALMIIGKSLYSVPVFRNKQVSERVATPGGARILIRGELSHKNKPTPSTSIFQDQPLRISFPIKTKDLTRIRLVAGTYDLPQLSYDLTVEQLDIEGKKVSHSIIPGHLILNNRWFSFDFEALSNNTDEVTLVFSTTNNDRDKPFSIWLNNEGIPVYEAFSQKTKITPAAKTN